MGDVTLNRLIAEASVLAGGQHPCDVLGHKWKSVGGRACPFHEEGCGRASQPVFVCTVCEEVDYGNHRGWPGYESCAAENFNCGGQA